MSGYRDLEIYKISYALAIRVHKSSLKLPQFELYEQGSQIRRSTKSIKDTIAEGYGRRRYKAEFIRYLVYAQASCDEATSQATSIMELYPAISEFSDILKELDVLGRKINNFISFVETNWKSSN
jgi:four helix bundle protein